MVIFDYEIVGLFYVIGFYKLILSCLIKLDYDFNLLSGVLFYLLFDLNCFKVVSYNMLFFLVKFGFRYELVMLVVYEGRFGYYI